MHHDIIREYMSRVQKVYATGETTEHSFRPALQYLFDHITDDVECINEPKMVTDVGRPDFVFKRTVGHTQITVGHCEAKDIDKDVNPRSMRDANKDQHKRYIKGLPNLIYTNGLDFHFYKEGELVHEIRIADFAVGITPLPQRYVEFAQRLTEFTQERVQTITSPERLAKYMAGKAILVKEALFRTLEMDPELQSELAGQYKAFKDQLIHDLTPEGFADIYAETVAYGMFAARLHDKTPEDFSREEALELLPKSNPFLRNLFTFVARQDLDERIRRDIDELAEIFQATNLQTLFENFGSFTQRNDPFIHFYETFLAEYNPKKRKARGVWYTPEPVVNFIVRAVDDVLKTEFGLPMGLADTSKITVPVDTGQTKIVRGKAKPIIENREMHRVQILDPATGTGTFLAEVIKQIAPKVKDIAPSKWSRYVEQDLIPRLHGFELLMASYAMCHMKLDMMLRDMDYVPTEKPPRLSVYLTNSLEEAEQEEQTLFMARWLSDEANAANSVKRDKPIMCIIGNPPYSGISQNMGDWAQNLIEPYKYVDGVHFGERKHWLHDDYVKFIAMSQRMIQENGEGILAFITNHGYLDNPTFRGMRWNLLNAFDSVHILDLHGNGKKKEVSPDGTRDANVFDIVQGVCIIVAIKKKDAPEKSSLTLKHLDYWGSRKSKYNKLWEEHLTSNNWDILSPQKPFFPFVPFNYKSEKQFRLGFRVSDLMPENVTGVVTARDSLTVDFTNTKLEQKLERFRSKNKNHEEIREEFFSNRKPGKYKKGDSRGWKLDDARNYLQAIGSLNIQKYSYRPFDDRHIIYDENMVDWPRTKTMPNFSHPNIGLVIGRQGQVAGAMEWNLAFAHMNISDFNLFYRGGVLSLPLYIYPDEQDLDQTRRVNMDPDIRAAIEDAAEHPKHGRPDEVAIFDYIYGVLHCPAYRETYAEFLKIDFPRVPYPSSPKSFWDIREKGEALRRLHLMEDAVIGQTPYPYTGEAEPEKEDMVEKPKFEDDAIGKVLINKTQGFENVPRIAWEFYIGGYQPAQKWLKDRKGRELSLDDIMHYQKIIKILSETDRIMKTIEMDLD